MSIFKRDRKNQCFLCGYVGQTERHHIFGASNRNKSEKYDLTVHLCHYCHNEPPNGVHQNKFNRQQLQAAAQIEWQNRYNKTTDDFIKEFGRNYIND